MIELRPYNTLGGAQHGWLETATIFLSRIITTLNACAGAICVSGMMTLSAPHTGFPAHPHRDMEIITYVRSGAITHQDSLGNRGRTEAGDVQVMSAGSGIIHSEMNEENEATQLFQIWIMPDEKGLAAELGD